MMMFGKLFIIALSLVYVQAATEKPKYTVMARAATKSHQVELRVYEPMIIAEVEIETERKSYATSQGFRILAGYIFGGNTKRQSVDMTAPVQSQENEDIEMTAPVQSQENIDMTAPVQSQKNQNENIDMTAPVQSQKNQNENIDMTAPVQSQKNQNENIDMTAPVQSQKNQNENIDMTAPVQSQKNQNENIDMTAPVQSQNIDMTAPVQGQAAGRNSWSVSFVMPSKYTLETLPIPNDDRVTLKQVPKQMFLTIRFSGWQTDRNSKMHEKLLMMYLEQNNLKQVAPPTYADYNEPWIPGWMRRNEILIQVEEVQL
jgi:hypothetical protein